MSAASRSAGPDAMVTVKITFDGVTCRAKMPLREMVPRALEDHIRTFLHIPGDTKIMIERYSDSAAAFVMLDTTNMTVYKQLYRAAKAKSKLKLRVSILHQEDSTSPKPASVEDAPESTDTTPTEPEVVKPNPTPLETASSSRSTLCKQYDANLLQEAAKLIQDQQSDFDSRLRNLMKSNDELNNLTSQMASYQPFSMTSQSTTTPAVSAHAPAVCPATGAQFAVCCNSCEKNIPSAHYHCSTCDDGDFDLCLSCVEQGITCYSDNHWLIKRTTQNGQIVSSTTETIAPKPKPKPKPKAAPKPVPEAAKPEPLAANDLTCTPVHAFHHTSYCSMIPSVQQPQPTTVIANSSSTSCMTAVGNMRTCNQCVRELPEREFLHCTTCEDYDLCQPCFARDAHGHHPKHGFVPAVAGTQVPTHIRVKMNPGRNQVHHAICDGCDTYIIGVRHKCLDCPDWDYCGDCVQNASFIHANHRFTAIYEPLTDTQAYTVAQPVHMGICCDGPLCSATHAMTSYIRGVRYKCAVCHDLDFCANCEASPANEHNKTHPLIKFKTPVRHVSVTTSGEHQDGQRMPTMGDRLYTNSKATETITPPAANSVNEVKTVINVQPVEATTAPSRPAKEPEPAKSTTPKPEMKEEKKEEEDLRAVFIRDSVPDGTIFPPNHVFEQTWVLRNEGKTSWPGGCSVKFVGGDYMGHVDSAHPAGISELVSASESTICYAPLAPGQEHAFTALLRTPVRPGKMISYWRLTTPDGMRFGHRLWCEVNVRAVAASEAKPKAEAPTPPAKQEPADASSQASSIMIFPKLEKESPSASMHEEVKTETDTTVDERLEAGAEEDDWDGSDEGFLTDEEYDILDASDEEFLEQQEKNMLLKK